MFFYRVFIFLLQAGIRIAGTWMPKAKEWRQGRQFLFRQLSASISAEDRIIWMHCASAGEFEQGKPVLEALRGHYPGHKLIVSFFSPSGYAAGKKYKGADHITYLPLDTRRNADRFVSILHPELVIFIKYDYWFYHLEAVAKRKIPLLMVSAIFRPQQPFFQFYGGLHRRMLHFFRWFFVQDAASVALLKGIDVTNSSVNGDTRFDRVAKIVKDAAEIPLIQDFAKGGKLFVAGSTWKEDEVLLHAAGLHKNYLMVIAPHEVSDANIHRLMQLFGEEAATYSSLQSGMATGARVLIMDNTGMLSRLYRYAHVAYIGGGYNKSGIHNTLEAAAWGKPVLFGPHYAKFKEARELIERGAARSSSGLDSFQKELGFILEHYEGAAQAAGKYVSEHTGASQRVILFIQENRLLTNS